MTGNAVAWGDFLAKRLLGRAEWHRPGAARVEAASGRRRQRARHLARDRQSFVLLVRVGRKGRSEQRLCVRMERLATQFKRLGQFDNLTEIHDRDAVADMRNGREVVADKEIRHAELVL